MMNSTDVGISKVSTDGLNCTHCCIATYKDSANIELLLAVMSNDNE